VRIKSHWFKDDEPKSAQQVAGAAAFIIWRVAQNALKRMRVAQFDIDPGPQFFAFSSEFLVFLIQIADRIAYQRLGASERVAFTTALAMRLGEILEDNQTDLLGPAGDRSYRSRFISLFNDCSPDYAQFHYDDSGPDFPFLRYLGNRMLDIMPEKDHSWVVSQVMEIEAPEAVAMVQKSMADLFETGPRPARTRRTRVSGD
jgi:hypothetical protein